MLLLEHSNGISWKQTDELLLYFCSLRSKYSKALFVAVTSFQDDGADVLIFLLAQ